MIRNGAFALWAVITLLAQPVHAARQCPAPAEMDRIHQCMDAVADPADAAHCAGRWNLRDVWDCPSGDFTVVLSREPVPCDTILLAKQMMAADYKRGKLVDPEILFEVIKGRQALMGCPPPLPQQTTTCSLLSTTFEYTCTTR